MLQLPPCLLILSTLVLVSLLVLLIRLVLCRIGLSISLVCLCCYSCLSLQLLELSLGSRQEIIIFLRCSYAFLVHVVVWILPIIDIRAILVSIFNAPVFVGSVVVVFKSCAIFNDFPNRLIQQAFEFGRRVIPPWPRAEGLVIASSLFVQKELWRDYCLHLAHSPSC